MREHFALLQSEAMVHILPKQFIFAVVIAEILVGSIAVFNAL